MGTGLIVCSACNREMHQDGDRETENGWRHCEDKSPRCPRAQGRYPLSKDEIVGSFCGMDDLGGQVAPVKERTIMAGAGTYVDKYGVKRMKRRK